MKKIAKVLSIIMALAMSIATFSALSVFADDDSGDGKVYVVDAPTVSDEEKEYRKYFFHEDFTGKEKANVNTSSVIADVKEAGGFWLCNADGGDYDVVDGSLKNMGTSYIDLQLLRLDDYSVKEDFVLSAKMMPLEEGINGWFLEFLRRDSSGAKSGKMVQFVDGKVFVGETDCGYMKVNEWLLIEIVCHWDAEERWFDSYTIMLNGHVVGSGDFDGDTLLLTFIEHFRMFRDMSSYQYLVDDINIISGTESILYASEYGTEPPADDDTENGDSGNVSADNGESDNGGAENSGTENDGANKEDSSAKADTSATTETENTEEEKGCSSTVTGSVIALIAVIGAGSAVVMRKKED